MSDSTRDAIVRALAEHDWHAADDFDWSRPCRHADHRFSAFCAVCSGDLGLMADALLASDFFTKLAEDEALMGRVAVLAFEAGDGRPDTKDVVNAIAAALSPHEGEPCMCGTDFTCLAQHDAERAGLAAPRLPLDGVGSG